ncbi:MAG: tetratricopeptide repeat protein [Xanthomonadales bacterium]|nr:tetratricopeptide repeat protein [Xanthomonadales bacterium]
MKLLAELKRRNVIRMGGLYLVGAWLILQVAETLLPIFHTPDWVLQALVVLLALGFLPAVVFSWLFELTPEGIKRDAEVTPDQSNASKTGRRMDRLIFAGVIALIVVVAADRYWPRAARVEAESASIAAAVPPSTPTDASAKASATDISVDPNSIAVLPFVNMSADKDNEYFSDGVAEEILNSLSKIKSLKVAGRTSSFSFKGKQEDLRNIGKTLGVAHILEGSVRKQGEKVRITAQLIRSGDGIHLWSETYDGDLKDVFALQESIARAITTQLKLVLTGQQATQLVNAGTTNAQAYALYLQATSIYARRDGDRFPEAIAALEEAIRLDPTYARAFARLTAVYAVLPSYSDASVSEAHAKVLEYAKAASALDPTLAEPYAALGLTYGTFRGKLLDQFQALERAIALDPDDVTTQFWYGLSLIKAGYFARGTALLDRALSLDPMLPNALRWRGTMYIHAGDLLDAEQVVRRARDLGMQTADGNLSKIVAAKGDYAEAVKLWVTGTQATMRGLSEADRQQIAEGIYGDAPARKQALDLLDGYLAQPHEQISQAIPETLLRLGQPERALRALANEQITDTGEVFALLWSDQGKPMRAAPGFDAFVRDFGFVAVWDTYGPPDMCRKRAPGDYDCE